MSDYIAICLIYFKPLYANRVVFLYHFVDANKKVLKMLISLYL